MSTYSVPERLLLKLSEAADFWVEHLVVRDLGGGVAVMVGPDRTAKQRDVQDKGRVLNWMAWPLADEALPSGVQRRQCLLAKHDKRGAFTATSVRMLVQYYKDDAHLPPPVVARRLGARLLQERCPEGPPSPPSGRSTGCGS